MKRVVEDRPLPLNATTEDALVLILLNGPPGSGKSTLAQRYVDDARWP